MARFFIIRIVLFGFFFLPATGLRAQSVEALQKDVADLKAQVQVLKDRKLTCTEGKAVVGAVDKWSPLSTCPEGFLATGLQRVDIQGDHNVPINHVNDFICNDQGCKAWCIGNGCTVQARCCKY